MKIQDDGPSRETRYLVMVKQRLIANAKAKAILSAGSLDTAQTFAKHGADSGQFQSVEVWKARPGTLDSPHSLVEKHV